MRATGDNFDALRKAIYRAAILVRLDFSTGVVAAHNMTGEYSFGGDIYRGVGKFGSIEIIGEDNSLRPQVIRMNLSLVDIADPDLLAEAFIPANFHGRPAAVYLLMLDRNFDAIDDPVEFWSGEMDHVRGALDGSTATLFLECIDTFGHPDRNAVRHFSDEDQQRLHAGDKFFEFAADNARPKEPLLWGGTPVGAGPGPGGGTGPTLPPTPLP